MSQSVFQFLRLVQTPLSPHHSPGAPSDLHEVVHYPIQQLLSSTLHSLQSSAWTETNNSRSPLPIDEAGNILRHSCILHCFQVICKIPLGSPTSQMPTPYPSSLLHCLLLWFQFLWKILAEPPRAPMQAASSILHHPYHPFSFSACRSLPRYPYDTPRLPRLPTPLSIIPTTSCFLHCLLLLSFQILRWW